MNVQATISASVANAVSLEAAANDTVTAFFKAYTKVSPKLKKAKSKEAMALVEEATAAMNKLSRSLGARKDGKKGGFSNVKHAPKHHESRKHD